MRPDLKFPFYAKASLVFIGLLAFITMLFLAQRIIIPIIYSVIIAIVLSPIVDFMVRKKIKRIFAIALTLLMVIVFTVLFLAILYNQLAQFSDSFPKLIEKFHEMLGQSVSWVSNNFNISTRK